MATNWKNKDKYSLLLFQVLFVCSALWQSTDTTFAATARLNIIKQKEEGVPNTEKFQIFMPLIMTSSQWQRITLQGQAPVNARSLEMVNDHIYVADQRTVETGGGLYYATNEGCSEGFPFSKQLSAPASRMLFRQQYGFVGSYGYGAFSQESSNPWAPLTSPLLPSLVYAFEYDEPQNRLFAGASNGIFHSIDWGKTWITTSTAITYPLILVSHIDSVWIGTYATGVWSLDMKDLSLDSKQFNLPSARIWDMLIDNNGNIYIATATGVYIERSDDDKEQWIELGLQSAEVFSLESDGQYLFAGIKRGGVKSLPLGTLDSTLWKTEQNGAGWNPSYSIFDMTFADTTSCHGLLAGTEDGVWILK